MILHEQNTVAKNIHFDAVKLTVHLVLFKVFFLSFSPEYPKVMKVHSFFPF